MNAFDGGGNLVSPRHLRKMYSAYERVQDAKPFQGEEKLSAFAPDLGRAHGELADATVRWGELYSSMMFGNLVHTSTVLLKRERLRAVGFFEESYKTGEDYDFHLRTCFEGPVALLDVPCIRYRIAGGADQLTSPKHQLEIARNGLRIREVALARDRSKIALSDAELGKIMARANAWVAHELFEQGNFEDARRYFRRAGLFGDPKAATLLKASIAHLPSAVAGSVMALIRKAKGKTKTTGASG